jgi:hypothetical protein
MPSVVVKKEEWDVANLQVALSGGSKALGIRTAPFALADFDELSLKTTFDRAKRFGPNRNAIQRTEGRSDHEGSIKLPAYYWVYVIERATELGVPLGYLEMTVAISFARKGRPLKTHTAVGCMLKEVALEAADGVDNISLDVPLDPMNIFWNGVDVWGNRLSST